jgi:hypothetical protein
MADDPQAVRKAMPLPPLLPIPEPVEEELADVPIVDNLPPDRQTIHTPGSLEDPWDEEKYRRQQSEVKKKVFSESVVPKTKLKTGNDLLGSYKDSPHHPASLALKYAVHRTEHANEYAGKVPNVFAHDLDKEFMSRHQSGGPGVKDKNGHVTIEHLHKFMDANPHLSKWLLSHQKRIGTYLKKYFSEHLKDIDGVPHLALTRGLNTTEPGRDHTLASYADVPSTGFGTHMHHRWVPLNKIWYAYALGSHHANKSEYGPENEFLVSPHSNLPASMADVKKVTPRTSGVVNNYAIKSPGEFHLPLRSQHLNRNDIVKFLGGDLSLPKNREVARQAAAHHAMTPDMIGEVLESFRAFPMIRGAAVNNENASSENIHRGLSDPDIDVRMMAFGNPNLQPEHLTRILQDKTGSAWMRAKVFSWHHAKLTPEHIAIGLNDVDRSVRGGAAIYAVLPEHITRALQDQDTHVRGNAVRNLNLRPEHVDLALKDQDPYIRERVLRSPVATKEQLYRGLQDTNSSVAWMAQQVIKERFGENPSIPLAKMALASIPPGQEVPGYSGSWDYDHVLPEAVRQSYRLRVYRDRPAGSPLYGSEKLVARLRYIDPKDQRPLTVGEVTGYVHSDKSITPHSTLWENHRGKGLGQAMYEALFAHAMHHSGVKTVMGGVHSQDASRVHKKLAAKHGLAYKARTSTAGLEPTDKTPYQYALKTEPVAKMAIKDLRIGRRLPGDRTLLPEDRIPSFDYSHLLDPKVAKKGYRVTLQHSKDDADWGGDQYLTVNIHRGNDFVGQVDGKYSKYNGPLKSLRVNEAHVEEKHRGNGLGSAAYEALMVHAKKKMGLTGIHGGIHSSLASAVHRKLAAKHGMKYKPEANQLGAIDPRLGPAKQKGDYDGTYGPYRYTIKSEGSSDLGFGFNESGYPLEDRYAFQGLDIAVENKKGSTRRWYDENGGERGSTKMHADYGYIEDCLGSDDEPIDVYVGPDEDAKMVYVVHQQKAPDFKAYDEDKVMLGYASEESAREAYLKQYNDDRFYGGMSSMTVETFRAKICEGGKITNKSELAKSDGGWWHGTPSGDLRGGRYGLHVGTRRAAEEALHARIGYPATGSWDGTREYGKTLLAGNKTLQARGIFPTGYNSGMPEEDHYPVIGNAVFGDSTPVLAHHKPNILPVQIVGPMSNSPHAPHDDFKANGYMAAQIKRGTAKRGYYYTNVGEDEGSVSAVVPNENHLKKSDDEAHMSGGLSGAPDGTIQPVNVLPATLAALTAAVPAAQLAPWSPKGLHPELVPIAQLESSWGKHMQHAADPRGPWHTAVGALGMKPETAHEAYLRSPALQKLYPGLTGPETFLQKLTGDSLFYNLMAAAHWLYLKKLLGNDSSRAAYGWRWGLQAAKDRVDPEHDPYVVRYKALLGSLQKAEVSNTDVQTLLTSEEPGDRLLGLRLPVLPHELESYLDVASNRGTENSDVIESLLKRPDLDAHQLHRILDLCSPDDRGMVLQHANADDGHINSVLESEEPDLDACVQHPKVTAAQIHLALDLARQRGVDLPTALPYFCRLVLHAGELSRYVQEVRSPATPGWFVSAVAPVLAHHPNLGLADFEAILRDSLHPCRPHVLTRKMSEMELLRYASDPRLNDRFCPKAAKTVLASQPSVSPEVMKAFGARGLVPREVAPAPAAEGFQKALADWLPLQKMAVKPSDFKSIARASTDEGSHLVDHKPHLEAHPGAHQHLVSDYRQNILGSPEIVKRKASKGKGSGLSEGITRKVVYGLKADPHNGRDTDRRFMVKPYHERVSRRLTNWMQHPIQGWSEMTTQGLFHAAGIGHLHQKVHVSEHPVEHWEKKPGDKWGEYVETKLADDTQEPMLVVHLEPDHQTVADSRFGTDADHAQEQARKISIMDFLTNNLDRHAGNLLINNKTDDLLAIDHGRNFQYRNTQKLAKRTKHGDVPTDSLSNYLGSALSQVIPPPRRDIRSQIPGLAGPGYKNTYWDHVDDYRNGFKPIVEEWWPTVSKQVRAELDKHLQSIKDPEVRAHIARNFHRRADMLDEMSEMGIDNYGRDEWHKTPVPMFRYGTRDHEHPDYT